MSARGFTPGPWVIGNADDFTMPRHGTMLVVRDGDVTGFVLAACGRPENMKAQANARLIAAAPDLYEALLYAFEHAPKSFYLDGKSTPAEWIEKARAALAKASQ